MVTLHKKRLFAFDGYIELCKTIMTTIASRLQAVKTRISEAATAGGRAPAEITLIAVSKTFPPEAIAEAWAAGQSAFGENYAQEGIEKIAVLSALLQQHKKIAERPQLARESTSSVARTETPRSGAPSPEEPLLRPLEWHVALPNQGDERTSGDVRPSAGVASPAGALLRPLEWHHIGPIQSNKTKAIAEHFDWVHGIDRAKIAERLSASRPDDKPPLHVCIQVNVSGEASKNGVTPDAVFGLAQTIMQLPRLRLQGLMAIPEPTPDTGLQRRRFRMLREIREELLRRGIAVDTLSMGMSDDLEAAIAEGATLVRVGRAIFGERKAAAG